MTRQLFCCTIPSVKDVVNFEMNFLRKFRSEIQLLAIFAAYCAVASLLHIPCLIKLMTGVSCPGCGMTRACLSCLRLDFDSAFMYHPLWCVLIPATGLFVFFKIKENKTAIQILAICLIVLYLLVYLYRMLFLRGDVVVFAPRDGLIYRMIRQILSLFIQN